MSNSVPVSVPGTTTWVDHKGSYSVYTAGAFNVKAPSINFVITAPPVDPVMAPFAEATATIQNWESSVAFGELKSIGATIYNGGNISLADPLQEVVKAFPFNPTDVIGVAQEDSEKFQHLEKCLTNNSDGASTLFNKIFDLSGGLGEAVLSEVNGLLPSWLQVSGNGDTVSVGPVVINQKTGQVGFNGQIFSGVVSDQLAKVNKVLPSFLGVTLTPQSIGIGDKDVYFEDLLKADVQVGDITVATEGNDLVIKMGDVTIANITDSAQDLAKGLIAQPLSALNQQLPDGFDVGITIDKDTNLPTFSVGPLSLGVGGLALDQKALGKLVEGQASAILDPLTTQLPKQAQWVAQALWKELDIGGLFLDRSAEVASISKTASTIKSSSFTCGTALDIPSGVPPTTEPAAFTDASNYETSTNDQLSTYVP